MSDAPELRSIRLVVPDRDRRHVAVDAGGELPSIELELGSHETTILALGVDLLPSVGLKVAVVDCYIDQSGVTSLTNASPDPVPVLVEVEPIASHALPAGQSWSWGPVTESFRVERGLQALLDDRLDVWRRSADDDDLRPDWARQGWLSGVSAWITDELARAGGPMPTAIVQFRHWGISAVVRVDAGEAEARRFWFKAVCPHFGHEPALTKLLAEHLGDRVASVIAVDTSRRWMLLHDLGDAVILNDAHRHRGAFDHLVSIQQWSAARATELGDDGVPARPLSGIHAAFVEALAEPSCAELLEAEPARIEQAVEWLAGAIDRVTQVGIPEVLVHGDFHPGNIAGKGERHVLFDWSDAAIAPPFVDIVTWTWWLGDDEAEVSAVWQSFARAWAGAPWIEGVLAERALVEAIAGAFHTVSYAGIVRNLDRHRRPENALGLRHFFGLVADAADAEAVRRTDLP